jgi:hypothetical protein
MKPYRSATDSIFLLIPHQSRDAVLRSNGRFAPQAAVLILQRDMRSPD